MISERVLVPRLAEVGHIKIGCLEENVRKTKSGAEWQAPKRLDHFLVTSMERGPDKNFIKDVSLHQVIGEKPTELDVVLLYNQIELNFRTELAVYKGKKPFCRGNGETARRLHSDGKFYDCDCPCELLENSESGEGKCKPHGVLTCLLTQSAVTGGVYKFSTTGWNSIRNLTGSLKFIHMATGGKMAGIPLKLKFFKKDTTTKDGKATKIGVVGLFYQGSPVALLEAAVNTAKQRVQAGIMLESAEEQLKREFDRQAQLEPIDADLAEEFHPDEEIEEVEFVASQPETTKPSIDDVFNKNKTTAKPPETKAPEAKKPDPKTTEESPNFFLCLDCGRVTKSQMPIQNCGCKSTNIQAFVDEAAAKKLSMNMLAAKEAKATEAPKPASASTPATSEKPVSAQEPAQTPGAEKTETSSVGSSKDATVAKIIELRGKHRIMQGIFLSIVAGAIKKPIADATKWTDDEAALILAAMEAKYAGVQ